MAKSTSKNTKLVTVKKIICSAVPEASVELKKEIPDVRHLKLQPYFRDNSLSNSPVPMLRICGKWFAGAGFGVDDYVSVTVMKGLLVIRRQSVDKK